MVRGSRRAQGSTTSSSIGRATPLVVARGPKARSAAIANGLEVHWQAPGETSAEVVAELARTRSRRAARGRAARRERVAAPRRRARRRSGPRSSTCPSTAGTYPTTPGPRSACSRRPPRGVSTRSPSPARTRCATRSSCHRIRDGLRTALDGPVAAVAVGPGVRRRAPRRTVSRRVVEPRRARLGAMVQALVAALAARHRVLRAEGHDAPLAGRPARSASDHEAQLTVSEARLLEVAGGARRPPVVPKVDARGPRRATPHAAEAAVARLRAKLGPARRPASAPSRGAATPAPSRSRPRG